MRTKASLLLLLAILLAGAGAASIEKSASAASDVKISEIRIDQPADDEDEYFELSGAPLTSLDGLTYLVIGDSPGPNASGVIEVVTSLAGQSIPASGYFVAAESSFTLGTANLVTDLNFENSDNVTHLLVEGFSGADGDDLDTNDDGTLDVTPWTSVLSIISLIEDANPPEGTEWHYGPPLGPDGNFVPAHAIYCPASATWEIGDADPAGGTDTPGAANLCPDADDFGACGDEATFIHVVQGDAATSPKVGDTVVVEAVVHGDFQETDELAGFFLQEEDADVDSNPQTSEGIFISTGGFGPDVAEGDLVRVQGVVEERFERTQLTDILNVAVCGPGNNITPAAITLPVTSLDDWEQSEGMAVALSQTLFVTGNYNQGRYGEVSLSAGGRLYNPTTVVSPGSAANALQEANDLRRILLDDGSSEENPEPPPYFALDGTLRAGDTLDGLSGALDYDFGTYRVHPTEGISFKRINERADVPEDVGGSLTIAGFNVLNYFTTIDEGSDICGPGGDMECRGADTPAEFQRQRTKVIAALEKMDADIVGLIEMENNASAAVADLVDGLNDAIGDGTYSYIDTGTIGTDVIKVALIYDRATITPVGEHAILDSSVDPNFNDDKNRPVLAQTFREIASEELVTVAVTHLKSKASSCDDVGDPDIGDGQGNCNLTRAAAAKALADWLAGDPTESGDPDVLIVGSLNAYAMETPFKALLDKGYKDLLEAYLLPEQRYSYVFFGQAGDLDHGLANATLAAQVRGATVWHINSDEPNALGYNNYNQPSLYQPGPYRSSDHDPMLVGLHLGDVEYTVNFPVIASR